ncbi:nucleotidyltransferase AbiEii toxin of type IV toxin-antitoxin system [Dermacoccus sp. SAI-028]|uniref:nucleotidyl transferase AbiEii/AbiGii toxin family protein n=1 Tax=unclassified Dermacoccus TaxID=2643059 RepID=UPI0010533C24|nr:nucleotidyl transferase AbiEii/AbiGii toxin family protein [Dermacoccus sp. SAI-028]TCJ90804.1 nucleotidyltransferase AbiEii toxin of type IV toxin-antitoxin system [Dermacoccus sp. SAI-028]
MKHSDASRSLGHRIRNAARERCVDPARLRRQIAFQRLLARLALDEAWVLKGGFLLEARFEAQARTTKDLDLVHAETGLTALDVQDLLDEALDRDLGDSFSFRVGLPRRLRDADDEGAWRVGVEASVGGTSFEHLTLDVVTQAAETAGAVETVEIPSPLIPSAAPAVRIRAVDLAQHAAEKVHAYSRIYAHDRPSSRVKDLVDLVLIIESGALDAARFAERVDVVFRVRDGAAAPADLPAPPASWPTPYAAMVADLDVTSRTSDTAYAFVRTFYQKSRNR